MALSLFRRPSLPTLSYAERGKLLRAEEIATEVLGGQVSRKWVMAHVPPQYRHKVGRVILFYEGEVRAWIDTLREAA